MEQTVKNTLSSDLICRPEYIGGVTLLAPFVANTASQRLMMYTSHATQSLVLDNAEQPRIMTGYEKIFGEYEFSTCRLNQDALLRRVLPKFNPQTHASKAGKVMPSWCVIYVGNDDRQVHCMDINTYTMLHEDFGYFNKMLGFENELLTDGNYIPKGTKLTTSPSHDGNRYMMGFNANVIFMADPRATEDSFTVSKTLAEKGVNTSFRQVKLNIPLDMVPLNLYGKDGEYQCFPKIGETVREDEALIGLRKINDSTYIQDMTPSALRRIEHNHDDIHRAPAGSVVVDVDVYINMDAAKRQKDLSIFKQFFDINECHKWQQDQILETYKQLCEREGVPCGPEFSTRVVREATLSGNKEFVKGKIRLCDAREPVEFITVVITYAFKRKITLGSKLTGREGGKGVVSAILDDEDMPVDDNGIRADIIMTPASIINRMNPSQMYEQFWNRTGVQVIRNVEDKYFGGHQNYEGKKNDWIGDSRFREHWQEIYVYIMGFFHDFRPAYAKFVDEELTKLQNHTGNNEKMLWVEECLNEGLYLINAFREPIPPEKIIEVAEKYGVTTTPVTYRRIDNLTGQKKTIRTKNSFMIGSKFLMLLGKIPAATLASIEVGYVNQFELPIKPKSKHVKSQAIIGLTPQKFG